MKTTIKKILPDDRKLLLLISAVILVLIFTFITYIYAITIEKKNNTLKAELTEIQSLSRGLFQIKNIVESKEKKIVPSTGEKVTGVVSTLEQVLNSLGFEASKLKPLGEKRINEFIEEVAELEIKGIDLNKIVNLLYKIDNSPIPMKIKGVLIKSTFEDPDLFTVNLTVSLMSKG